ncbi:Uncharacterized conserved protein YkwD, contains CAP (CSP/antigen 5/PR1) domain [Micrococcales bacterium KH10]|nr:Uncharacterized conserved protein YkwD, contains CAP (CSP/antigen 5/PR1) domain [Micrococcales bacterium KH10]
MTLVLRFRQQQSARSHRHLVLFIVLTLIAAMAVTTVKQSNTVWANSSSANSFEAEVLRLTNIERTNEGLNPLTWSNELGGYSRYWSEYMAATGYWGHGPNPWNSYPPGWRGAAENIATGQRSAASVVAAWMNSEGHRANILQPSYTHLGVGYALRGTTPYWTQNFAQYSPGVNPDANPKPLGSLTSSTTPIISGSPAVGATLTAVPGQWDEFVVLSYQWLRGTTSISGATGTSYTVQDTDAGCSIAVRVTGYKYGAAKVSLTSVPIGPVPGNPTPGGPCENETTPSGAKPETKSATKNTAKKRTAKIRVKVAKKKVRQGKRTVVTVRVGSAGKPAKGKVAVRFGKKRVVGKLKNGRARVKSPRLTTRGKVKVKVRYRGTSTIKAKRAPAVVMRVR